MCDLAHCSFVASPGSTVSALYEQYIRDLSGLLDKHAPTVTRNFTKEAAGWLSDTYLQAKAVRCQFERFWWKDKSPQNQARLCKQIARCSTPITRTSLIITETLSATVLMTPRNCGRFYTQYYTLFPRRYSPLTPLT